MLKGRTASLFPSCFLDVNKNLKRSDVGKEAEKETLAQTVVVRKEKALAEVAEEQTSPDRKSKEEGKVKHS